jgi:hypothetical protein
MFPPYDYDNAILIMAGIVVKARKSYLLPSLLFTFIFSQLQKQKQRIILDEIG